MSHNICTFQGARDETLVAYLYDDLETTEREVFDAHVGRCEVCRAELEELRGVRVALGRWTPPEPARPLVHGGTLHDRPGLARSRFRDIPVWAQAAAALLVLGVAAGVANLDIAFNRDGVRVRTGWGSPIDPVVAENVVPEPSPSSAVAPPWRAELDALEQRLRTDLESSVASVRDGSGDRDMLRRVRALIEESERTQRNELALRVAEVARDVQTQRAADLQRIQYSLGVIENTTGVAMRRQGQLLNNLAVRVSQQQ